MEMLFFSGINPKGEYQECFFGGPDIEASLFTLTRLVGVGWQLVAVELQSGSGTPMPLPVAAFDGELFTEPLKVLQHEWESVLEVH